MLFTIFLSMLFTIIYIKYHFYVHNKIGAIVNYDNTIKNLEVNPR
jgi:hypothetical protein